MQTFPAQQPLLPDLIALHGKWRAHQLALVCGDTRLTWGELTQRIYRSANTLSALGLNKGDRLVVLMSNGVPMFEVLMGAMVAGVVSVPMNLSVNAETIAIMVQDAGAKMLLITEDQRALIEDEAFDTSSLTVVCSGEDAGPFVHYEAHTAKASCARPDLTIDGGDYLNIIYSSGTTGQPKGIIHTHQGRRDWAQDVALALRYTSQSRIVLNIGLYSNISWAGILGTVALGGACIIHQKFDALDFLHTVEREGVTHCAMVPLQFQRILDVLAQRDFDLSSCQGMVSAGSPLFEEIKKSLFEKFKCGIIELYGLTEGVVTTLDPEDAEGRWASVGKPIIGVDIKLVGDDDKEVPIGQKGEIVSRGRITMPCYFNRPEATAEAMWKDPEGNVWMRTGDVAVLDHDHFIYIVDRKKDMILSGGQNIYPQDIEAVIVKHPAVEEVAVIAANSQRWGETPLALVVLKQGVGDNASTIKSWSNTSLGKQQRIADVIVVEQLPRNANGKLLKRELRQQYQSMSYD